MVKITTLQTVKTGVIAGLLALMAGCGTSNQSMIGQNVTPGITNLEDVKTYAWISDIDEIPDVRMFRTLNGTFYFNNESARKKIKDAVEYELNARGYKMPNASGEPGMLVSFYVSEQGGTLRKTNGYVNIRGEVVIPSENVEEVAIEPGTLIVNVIDNKTKKMVWQGFASGIIKPEELNDRLKIRQAVSSIFSKFDYDAKDSNS
jgi:hypothetical protein